MDLGCCSAAGTRSAQPGPTVVSTSSRPLRLTPSHQSPPTSKITGSAGKQILGGLTHEHRIVALQTAPSYEEDAGHRHDRVFEPNRTRDPVGSFETGSLRLDLDRLTGDIGSLPRPKPR